MEWVEVRTQAELDAAIKAGHGAMVVAGATVTAYGNSTVRACGDSTVTAYGNSTVRACGNSTVRACDNSTVTAYDNSTVTAYELAIALAWSARATITDTPRVTVIVAPNIEPKVSGGVIVRQAAPPKNAQDWCEDFGVETKQGVAYLFKGLDDKCVSPHGMSYAPGTIPEAPDWDGGKVECGGGLHFSPHPILTHKYIDFPKKYVRCPVEISTIVVHFPAQFPDKVKAPRCCGPVEECDIDGKPIQQ